MKRYSMILFALASAAGAAHVDVKLDEITKPAAAVTADIKTVTVDHEKVTVKIDDVVISEDKVRGSIAKPFATLADLEKQVREGKVEKERLAALASVWDQDLIFKLFIKPGLDKNVAVRVAAANALAELDLMKVFSTKVKIPEVQKAAQSRLDSVYGPNSTTDSETPPVFREYAKRMKRNMAAGK